MLFLTPTAVLHGLLRTSFSIFWFAIGLFSIIFSIANNDAIGSEKHKLASSRTKTAAAFPSTRPYGQRPDVMALADAIAAEHQADPQWVRTQLAQAHHIPSITQYILPAPSGTAKNWRVYRSRFVEPIRIAAGVKFWKAHVALLERAEQTYGVPPEIVVGIIGVESIYGRQTGNFRVIDTLATLSMDFPTSHPRAAARQAFFRDELSAFIGLHYRAGTDARAAKGSYAGAMGMPQFMPSSWVRFAVDFDGDGKIDLHHSSADVIGSVAHYFQAFNWQPGMPTHYPVQFDTTTLDLDALLVPDILPTFTPASFSAKGAILDATAQQHKGPLALIELQNGTDTPQYVAGTDNFYAITRYNWSSYYAMAVIELGQAVRAGLPVATPAR